MQLQTVRPNIVQSIRAYRVDDLMQAAQNAGQHFLYANLTAAQSKQDVLEGIAEAFLFPAHFGKNLDALFDCMTDLVHKAGSQPGFVGWGRLTRLRRRAGGEKHGRCDSESPPAQQVPLRQRTGKRHGLSLETKDSDVTERGPKPQGSASNQCTVDGLLASVNFRQNLLPKPRFEG
jgi:hypothetical protein